MISFIGSQLQYEGCRSAGTPTGWICKEYFLFMLWRWLTGDLFIHIFVVCCSLLSVESPPGQDTNIQDGELQRLPPQQAQWPVQRGSGVHSKIILWTSFLVCVSLKVTQQRFRVFFNAFSLHLLRRAVPRIWRRQEPSHCLLARFIEPLIISFQNSPRVLSRQLHLLNGTSKVSVSRLSCPTEGQASGNAAGNVNTTQGCSWLCPNCRASHAATRPRGRHSAKTRDSNCPSPSSSITRLRSRSQCQLLRRESARHSCLHLS